MTESKEPYRAGDARPDERFARWTESIPEEFRAPEPGSPRARILAAAAEQFAGNGFSRSTTRAIAEAAGVNQAMIHYYFQSKTELYERVLAGMVVDLLSSLATSMPPETDEAMDVLTKLPERIVAVFATDPVRVAILRREMGGGAVHLRAVVDRLGASGPRGFRGLMTQYIEGAFGGDAATAATTILTFLMVHAYGMLLVEPMLRHVLTIDDSQPDLVDMMARQRPLVRRALTGSAEEDVSDES